MLRTLTRTAQFAAAALLVLACTACGPQSGPPATTAQDQRQEVVDIVMKADPSASNIHASNRVSGLSRGWSIEIDHEGEVTPELLESILVPVAALDSNPVDITLYFFEPGTDEAIDIAPAADQLGVPWTPVGSGGSWLAGQVE